MNKILTFCVSLIAIFVFLGLMPVHGEAEIYDNVVRLHVVANSNSDEDQSLKLKVRDSVIEEVNKICREYSCKNSVEASEAISAHIDDIRKTAEKCIEDEGYKYSAEVLLGRENYPTKNYEELAFPKGRYLSLQIKIGEGEGENWWCVLFPPLCLSSVTETEYKAEDAFVNLGFSSDQYKIITQSDNVTYNVRFKVLETIEGVFS